MRDRSEVWCETSDLCLNEIERRAVLAYEQGGVVTTLFISLDLYQVLLKSMATTQRSIGPTTGPSPHAVIRIMTSVGEIHIQKVNKFRNFLLAGTKDDFDAFIAQGVDPVFWNDQERLRVDKAFEDLIILEGEISET